MAEGALFVMQQPLALLILLACGLLLQSSAARQLPFWLAAFLAVAALPIVLPTAAWQGAAAAGFLAVAGGWQAAGQGRRGMASRILAVAGGLPFGWAASLGLATPAEATGSLAVAPLLLALVYGVCGLVRAALRAERRWALACRILGSWLAAVGLLLLALALARGR